MEPAPGGPIKITQAMNINVISLSLALVPTQISCSFSLQGLFAGVFLASEFSAVVVARLAGFRFLCGVFP